jgi:AraC family transcriptional regulator
MERWYAQAPPIFPGPAAILKGMDASVPVNPPRLDLGSPNAILNGRASFYHVRDFPGSLSVKAVVRGAAVWETAAGRHVVDADRYLILPHGQTYSLTIESCRPVETFILFLRRGLVDEAAAALGSEAGRLLDDPGAAPEVVLAEKVRRHDDVVTPSLRALQRAVAGGSPYPGYLEERFEDLAGRLAAARRDVRRQMARLGVVRPAAKAELYRRLVRARDFIEASLDRPVTLFDMARVACVSPHHFHRQFARAFGAPPHRWLTRRRLDEARRLLEETGRSVSEVCLDVGFQSLGSFSALFRRRFGVPPSALGRRRNG